MFETVLANTPFSNARQGKRGRLELFENDLFANSVSNTLAFPRMDHSLSLGLEERSSRPETMGENKLFANSDRKQPFPELFAGANGSLPSVCSGKRGCLLLWQTVCPFEPTAKFCSK